MTTENELRKYVVGQPCPGARLQTPGAVMDVHHNGVFLHVEIANRADLAVLQSALYVGLLNTQIDNLWMGLFRFRGDKDELQFDCPFHGGVLPAEHRLPMSGTGYLAIPMVIIDHADGTVLGARVFTITPHAHRILSGAFNRQIEHPLPYPAYMEAVEQTYRKWKKGAHMRRDAILMERAGGNLPR